MESISALTFSPVVPELLIAVLAAAGVALVGYGALRRATGIWWRGLVVAVAVATLLNPTLVNEQRRPLPDVAVVVVDDTASQQLGARAGRTAEAAAQIEQALARFDGLETRLVTLDDGAADEGTRLAALLRETLIDVPPERVAGTVVITDGQVHDLPEDAHALAGAGPVHVLLSGDRDARDRRLVIEQAPSYGVVGDEVALSLSVEDPWSTRETAEVAISVDGGPARRLQVRIGEPTEYRFEIEHGGVTAAEIVVEAGASELTLDNNRAAIVVNGVRDRLRVMLVSGEPNPGLRSWRNLLKADPAVELVHFTILRPPNKQDLTPVRELSLIPFPSGELFATNLEQFDLIIFDRYHRRGILPMLYLSNVVDYVREGGAVLDSAGPAYATELSLATTPLGDILPASPTGGLFEEPYRARLTEAGRRHPVTAELPGGGAPEAEPDWGRWFRLVDSNVARGTVVLRGIQERPVLVLDRVGEGRVAQLLSDHAWLWGRGFDGGGPQSDLLRRLVHWLMKEPDLEEDALTAEAVGRQIDIVRRSLADIEGAVTITGPGGDSVAVALDDLGEGRGEASFVADRPGIYRLAHDGQVAIAVVGAANPLEMRDVGTTEAVLAPLVAAAGGTFTWLAESDVPNLRRVAGDGDLAGGDWIGVRDNHRYVVTGLSQLPLLPALLLLVVLLGGLMLAWRAEGR